ncbi:MAG TPA: hypothetical protein PLF85_17205, partial [Turneriella sp.]|nr:hypothetical protein [Turneriella sp.]
ISILIALYAPGLVAAPDATEPPEYYCHEKKEDRYIFADADQKDECRDMGGRFGTFSRKERKYFCRLSDSGFYLGKSYSRKKAEEKCAEASGTLQ